MENKKEFNPSKNWEDFNKSALVVILMVVIILTSKWIYHRVDLKSKCQKMIKYVPAEKGVEFVSLSHDAYFELGVEKFESREAAVAGCLQRDGK